MDLQCTETGSNDCFARFAAWIALILSATIVGFNPGAVSTAGVGTAVAHVVPATENSTIPVLTATLGGVFAGTVQGVVLAMRHDQSAAVPVKSTLGGTPTAMVVTDLGLWVATARTDLAPAKLFLMQDPIGAQPKVLQVEIPGLGADGEIAALTSGLGRLWVGTSKGLFSYDWSRWSQHQPPSRFALPGGAGAVKSLFLDARGILWIGTTRGLISYNGVESFVFSKSQGLPHDSVTAITGDNEGNLFCGTEAGLASLSRDVWVRQSAVGDRVTALLVSGDSVWVGTAKGLFRKAEGQWVNVSAESRLPTESVLSLAFGTDRVYVGTPKGVWCLPLVSVTSAS